MISTVATLTGVKGTTVHTLSFYHYKWKLKCSIIKLCWQASISTTRGHDLSLTSFSPNRPYLFVLNPFMSPPLRVTALEVNISRWAFKAISLSSWGADATILGTANLALVHFTAEYCLVLQYPCLPY